MLVSKPLGLAILLLAIAALILPGELADAQRRGRGGGRQRSGNHSHRTGNQGNITREGGNRGGNRDVSRDRPQRDANRERPQLSDSQRRDLEQRRAEGGNRDADRDHVRAEVDNRDIDRDRIRTNIDNRDIDGDRRDRTFQGGDRDVNISGNEIDIDRDIDIDADGRGWSGGGWYGDGYLVPPAWGWAGFATGLVIGAAVSDPPPHYDTVYVGSSAYIYSDGVCMESSGDEYIVVAPPTSVTVPYLPEGCEGFVAGGDQFYDCSGIYYQPVIEDGESAYVVVEL